LRYDMVTVSSRRRPYGLDAIPYQDNVLIRQRMIFKAVDEGSAANNGGSRQLG